jgi:hypothetical protein
MWDRTRKDYANQIKLIERRFGDLPIAALSDPRTRNILLEWRERLALASPRQADYAWAVLARILAWALDRRRLVPTNPCERAGLMYGGGDRALVHAGREQLLCARRSTCICHFWQRCGPDSARAICSG